MRHWTLARDAEGIALLTLDKEGASANTLGADVLAELNEALDLLDARPAGRSRDRIGQGERLHRRRRRRRVQGHRERGGRARDRAPRLGYVRASRRRPLSDCRAHPRLLPGRRAGARARVPLSRRRRRTRHATRPARSHARDRAGLGRDEAPAAIGRCAGGARHDADRTHDRRPPREATRDCRRVRAAADHGQRRARHPQGAPSPTPAAVSALADAEPAGAARDRGKGQTRSRQARAPRALSRALRDPRHLGRSTTAMRSPCRRRIRRRFRRS